MPRASVGIAEEADLVATVVASEAEELHEELEVAHLSFELKAASTD